MDDFVTINIVGDFYISNLNDWSLDGSLKDIIKGADINVVNLEAPIRFNNAAPSKKSGPSLYQDESVAEWLEEKGFNVIDFANNHIADYGEESIRRTIESFSKDTTIIGVGRFDDAYKVRVVECKCKRIGFLALTQYEFGVHDDAAYTSNKLGAAWICHPKVDELIKDAHRNCDFLIVLPHAGLENFSLPLPELRTLYHHYIDMGADVVIASHPHIVQPWEEYNGKQIMYSVGNFCFDLPNTHVHAYKGLLAQLRIDGDGRIQLNVKPTCFDRNKKIIRVCNNADYGRFLIEINDLFRKKQSYVDEVNKHCAQLKPMYDMILNMSGYHQVCTIRKATSVLIMLVKAVLKRKPIEYNDAHFINTIRCETHRWVMSRIYEFQNTKYN